MGTAAAWRCFFITILQRLFLCSQGWNTEYQFFLRVFTVYTRLKHNPARESDFKCLQIIIIQLQGVYLHIEGLELNQSNTEKESGWRFWLLDTFQKSLSPAVGKHRLSA